MIDFLVLGTGAMLPLPTRWLSSVLVRVDGELILFDCGEGTQIPWRSYGWGFRRLGTICLSHYHADHIAGLPGLLHTVANSGREEPLTIYGPAGTEAVVAGLRTIAPILPFEVIVRELGTGDTAALPAGLSLTTLQVDHRIVCIAYRLDLPRARRFNREAATALGVPRDLWHSLQQGEPVSWPGGSAAPEDVLGPPRSGISFAFITDTRPTPEMPAFCRGVDLLICEGTYGDSNDIEKAIRNTHMTYAEAATIAKEAEAKALLLTHFSPAMEDPDLFIGNAGAIFPATTIAHSGLTLTLSFPAEGS
jgi:ribonuclease Z